MAMMIVIKVAMSLTIAMMVAVVMMIAIKVARWLWWQLCGCDGYDDCDWGGDDCDDSHGGDNDYGDADYFSYHRPI